MEFHPHGLSAPIPLAHPPLPAPNILQVGTQHLKDPVTKAETGQARRAVEAQLVVEGGTSRVWVSASDCIQHGAHRCGLRDLSPRSRGPQQSRSLAQL